MVDNEYVLASDVVAVLKTMHIEGYCVGNNEAMLRIFEELANLKIVKAVPVVRCQNCGWWHRHKSGDLSSGVCDKYAMSKRENGYCDEPLLEERK